MYSYLIIHQNSKIKIYEYDENQFKILKNNGESEQDFDSFIFWNWWKDKVNYQEEEVAFVVLTDEDFLIPSDIIIADYISFSKKELKNFIDNVSENLKMFSYPSKFFDLVLKNEEKQILIEKTEESVLNMYFKNKTKEMKN